MCTYDHIVNKNYYDDDDNRKTLYDLAIKIAIDQTYHTYNNITLIIMI